GPRRRVLPVKEHDVEVVRAGEPAELVELLLRVDTIAGRHLRHDLVALAGQALQGDAEHSVHLAVGLGRLEEADAAVVGMAHEPREAVLSERTLYPSAETARAERKPADCDARPPQRDQIARTRAPRAEGKRTGDGKCSGGEAGLQEVA